MTKNSYLSTKTIFDNLFSGKRHQLLKELDLILQGRGQIALVFTPNLEQLALAGSQERFAQTLGLADFLLPDGMGLVWGSRFLSFFGKSKPVAERISGREVVFEILNSLKNQKKHTNQKKQIALIVGGKDYDKLVSADRIDTNQNLPVSRLNFGNNRLDNNLGNNRPDQNLIYWAPGFKKAKKPTAEEKQSLLDLIAEVKPSVVFVALGAPDQEYWISANKDELAESGVKIAMAVGGSFDVILGKLNRPPNWIEKSGLEWLYRLWQEPWRWRRQLKLFVAVKQIVQLALRGEEEKSS